MNTFSNEEFDFSFLEEGFTARDVLEQKINEVSLSRNKDSFYVADLGDIVKKHVRWFKALPRVTPFYAVKCNNNKSIVKMLSILGAGFDCASKAEIQLVQSLGVSPERIIYANPCKPDSQIKYAAISGVEKLTFDCESELVTIAQNHPNAKLVLRIATGDSRAVCLPTVKFGASLKACRTLLERAKELNMEIIGVCFHVGNRCTDRETFVQAVSDARNIFDMATELGFSMRLLDIGGGFFGHEDVKLKFEDVTSVLNPALDKYFPADSGVQIIAEPGRYYVASAFTLAVNIITKKVIATGDDDSSRDKTFMYYVNDGIYGAFSCTLYDRTDVKPVLHKKPKLDEKYYLSSLWGPTCNIDDRIKERCDLPELQVGDWILFENMGAYTEVASSTFNGIQRPLLFCVISRSCWQLMHDIQEHGIIPQL
ncbi:ornithine decarboxylase [Leptodactylus fuscus]|uniref:ornithine decarboxylase n=1 Tax=Leptodactylus fuscus TaxID=238119 RepID=UPI003F4F0622